MESSNRASSSFSAVKMRRHCRLNSSDGTADAARRAAAEASGASRLTILGAPPLPPGWSGKLWAVRHGIAYAERADSDVDYFWLTDADIPMLPPSCRVRL